MTTTQTRPAQADLVPGEPAVPTSRQEKETLVPEKSPEEPSGPFSVNPEEPEIRYLLASLKRDLEKNSDPIKNETPEWKADREARQNIRRELISRLTALLDGELNKIIFPNNTDPVFVMLFGQMSQVSDHFAKRFNTLRVSTE